MSTGPQPPRDPSQESPGGRPGEVPGYPPTGYPPTGYPPGGYGPGGYPSRPPMRPDEEKLWAIAAHLGPLLVGVIAPLVVWLVFKDRSAFLDRTGKEALNMQISYLIYGLVSGFSIVLLVGILLFPVVMLAWLVLMVVATVKVSSLEDYRYPLVIRFVS